MNIELIGNIIGMIGMTFLLSAYYMVQNEKVKPKDLSFIVTNLIWAFLMLISLSIHFNLGSFVLECIFLLIGLKALYWYYKDKKEKQNWLWWQIDE